jgi:hypothetical protein
VTSGKFTLLRFAAPAAAILCLILMIAAPCAAQLSDPPPDQPAVSPPELPVESAPGAADVRHLPALPAPLAVSKPSPPAEAIIRVILGLFLLIALAYVAGQPALVSVERRFAINPIVTTGLIFVFLGTIASRREVGVLTEFALGAIAPVVPLGLGWIGFRTGLRFDRRLVMNPPPAAFVVLAVVIPMIATVAGGYGCLIWLAPELVREASTFRDALLLGLASAMTSPVSVAINLKRFLGPGSVGSDVAEKIFDFVKVEHAVGVAGLLLVSLYFRPDGQAVAWDLPPTGWLFIALGIGVTMGVLTHLMLQLSRQSSAIVGPQFIVVLLGSICLTAGLASYLRLSGIGVCFVAGIVVSILPSDWRDHAEGILDRMERPVYFVLLLVAGALWLPGRWKLWILAAVFFLARLAGKYVSLTIGWRQKWTDLPAAARTAMVLEPIGPFAIAIIITGRDLYPLGKTPGLLTAVIGGVLLNEVFSQFIGRRFAAEKS